MNLYQYCNNSPLTGIDPNGLEVRSLNQTERRQLYSAFDFMKATTATGWWTTQYRFGNYLSGMDDPHSVSSNPIKIDTEIGGAAWRDGTLYLSQSLFSSWELQNTRVSSRTGKKTDISASNFEGKSYLASILVHEMNHYAHGEILRMIPFGDGPPERRAWDAQIQYLNDVGMMYRGDAQRTAAINSNIARAKEGRAQYGN